MSMTPKGWSISALAVELNMDRRTVAKRIAHLEPVGESGNAKLYRLADVVEALTVANIAKPADYDDARTRKMAADAVLAEIEVAKARQEVVEIGVAEKVMGEEYAAVRAKLLNIPDKLAPLCETTEGVDAKRELLRRGIGEALEELSSDRDLGPAIDAVDPDEDGGETGGGQLPQAPSRSDSEPVGGSGAAA